MSIYVDIHAIQAVPPSCINRDDTGSPKTAFYGGFSRARVSSQAWKRAIRVDFKGKNDPTLFGRRTKRVVADLAAAIAAQAPDLREHATEIATAAFGAAGIKVTEPKRKKNAPEDAPTAAPESGYLLFLSRAQIENIAETAIRIFVERGIAEVSKAKKDIKPLFRQNNSVDIALFGRMVADDKDLNVDASCQVAHALSTHGVQSEFDFFTAVDDAKEGDDEDAGAGMMGTVEFNSSTLYRFATVNLDGLRRNLGSSEATIGALRQFADSFVRSMPTGKENTFANRTLPEAVVIAVRDDQPVSWVGAFEKPVKATDKGYVEPSVKAMVDFAEAIDNTYGHKAIAQFGVALPAFAPEISKIAEVSALPAAIDALVDEVAPLVRES